MPWNNPEIRNLIDEWLQMQQICLRRVHPSAYIDVWGRICGQVEGGFIDCNSHTPDRPPDWDNYHYLWVHNWCPDYFSYSIQNYVNKRLNGTSSQDLLRCKSGRNVPCVT